MRTIYLGNTHMRNLGQRPTFTHAAPQREPEGDDMPVFDRGPSGHRGEYERPARDDAYEGTWVSNPNRRR